MSVHVCLRMVAGVCVSERRLRSECARACMALFVRHPNHVFAVVFTVNIDVGVEGAHTPIGG